MGLGVLKALIFKSFHSNCSCLILAWLVALSCLFHGLPLFIILMNSLSDAVCIFKHAGVADIFAPSPLLHRYNSHPCETLFLSRCPEDSGVR